jgi:glycosyltransferase involved in cell wall biosynthesis
LPRTYRRTLATARRQGGYEVLHVNQGHCYLAARQAFDERWPGVFIFRSHGLDDRMGAVLSRWRRELGSPARPWPKALPGRVLDWLLDRHIALACRYISGAIVSSSLDRDFLISHHGMPSVRVACLPQAASPRFLGAPPCPLTPDRAKHLLFIGSEFWKGTHAVAAGLTQLLSEDPELLATWVCPERSRAAMMEILGPAVRPRVAFPGWMSQESLMGLYDSHGVLLCPSLFEGFCKAFLEGMARGMCVIGTPTGGMCDIVRDGGNGFVVPFNDPQAIVAATRRVLRNPALAASIATCARRTASEYSWLRTASETAAFYQQLQELPPRWAEA